MTIKYLALALAVVAMCVAYPQSGSARGGGGGRGGGGRGAGGFGGFGRGPGGVGGVGGFDSRGGAGFDRSPSLSRSPSFNRDGDLGRTTAGYRPNTAGLGDRGNFGDRGIGDRGFGDRGIGEAGRPTTGDLGHFLNLNPGGAAAGARPGAATRPAGEAGNRVAGQGIHNNNLNIGNRTNVGNRANIGNRDYANNVRNNLNPNSHNWYNHNWWNNHPGCWNHGWNYWHGWGAWGGWGWASWGALTGYMLGSWGQPIDYGYGDGGNVVYQDNSVYVDGQPVGTQQQYAQQAQQLASTPVDAEAQSADWMPLGVFAVSTTEHDDHPVMTMQLAVSKQGNIAGMYYNTSSDAALPIQGAVDRKTQRAAWTVGDKKSTVLETGIFNLTKDDTPVLVHFGEAQTQTWYMVRLEAPNKANAEPGLPGNPAPANTLDGPSGR